MQIYSQWSIIIRILEIFDLYLNIFYRLLINMMDNKDFQNVKGQMSDKYTFI